MNKILDPVDYWKLRAVCSEAQHAAAVAAHARENLLAAQRKQSAALLALGLDPDIPTFSLDDDRLTITIPDPSDK